MNDYIVEQLIKQEKSSKATIIKIGMMLLTFLVAYFFPVYPMVMLWVLIIVLFADVMVFRSLRLEFEYIYFNGDLDIDKIMNQAARKRLFTTNIKEIEIIAPKDSDDMRPFQQLKVLDYSSQNPEHKVYAMVTKFKGETVKVLFEPNQKILDGMKYLAPRKVKI